MNNAYKGLSNIYQEGIIIFSSDKVLKNLDNIKIRGNQTTFYYKTLFTRSITLFSNISDALETFPENPKSVLNLMLNSRVLTEDIITFWYIHSSDLKYSLESLINGIMLDHSLNYYSSIKNLKLIFKHSPSDLKTLEYAERMFSLEYNAFKPIVREMSKSFLKKCIHLVEKSSSDKSILVSRLAEMFIDFSKIVHMGETSYNLLTFSNPISKEDINPSFSYQKALWFLKIFLLYGYELVEHLSFLDYIEREKYNNLTERIDKIIKEFKVTQV